jgi:predicted ester cyclase
LNRQDWQKLERYVDNNIYYNDKRIGLSGYRKMLEKDFYDIPDLYFNIQLLVSDGRYIASRLSFDCSPMAKIYSMNSEKEKSLKYGQL